MTITPGVYGQTVILGALMTQPDIDPETGEPITPPELLPGWHVNVLLPIPESLQAYAVTPGNPRNVYAGDAAGTGFLRFDTEAQGVAALIAAGLLAEGE